MATEAPQPFDRSGIDALWPILDTVRRPVSLVVRGRWALLLAESARAHYHDQVAVGLHHAPDGADVDTLVDIDGAAADTTAVAASRVERAVTGRPALIVFSAPCPSVPGEQPTGRWPAWWDDLFDRQGYVPDDRLRGPLWDHPGWHHRYLQGLTAFVPADVVPESEPKFPRSVVHPATYTATAHLAEQAAAAMAGGRLAGSFTNWLDGERTAWDEERQALARQRDSLGTELEALGSVLDAARADAMYLESGLYEVDRSLERAAASWSSRLAEVAERASLQQRRVEQAEHQLRLTQEQVRIVSLKLRARTEQLAATPAPPADTGAWSELGSRAVGAARRRAERTTVALAHRAATADGPVGKVAARAASILDQNLSRSPDVPTWLFLADHFLAQLPVLRERPDPFAAYLERGWQLGGDPHPLFDTEWYLTEHDVDPSSDRTPIEHYHRIGWRLGFNPHPLFDGNWYLRQYPGVAEAGMNPLWHFIFFGWGERRIPHPLFDTAWYLDQYPEIRNAAINPLIHFVTDGWRMGYEPGPMFDARYYVARHPDVTASGRSPWRFYLEVGRHRGDRPSPWAESFEAGAQRVLTEWAAETPTADERD